MNTFLSPKEAANTLVAVGKNKVNLPIMSAVILGILAGVFIGFGAQMATTVATGSATIVGFGITKMLAGGVFSVGLMLVIIAGAELFTGNNLIVKTVLKGELTWAQLFKSWLIVYIANFIGSVLLVYIVFYAGVWASAGNELGATALKIANGKVNLDWGPAFFRAIACNWLVCLAVVMAVAAKDIVSKIFACFFPIMTFVACGFEHSIANMYFIPMGILLKGQEAVVTAASLTADKMVNLTWSGMFMNNIIPVTLGNIVGGGLFVASLYYLVYCRECEK